MGTGYAVARAHTYVHAKTLQHTRQGRTLDYSLLSGLKPAMLVSSVQAVVAYCATAPRVCTLVLFWTPLTAQCDVDDEYIM